MKRILVLLALGAPVLAEAQGVTAGVNYWFKSPHVMEYRLGVGGFGRGSVRIIYSAQFVKQADSSKAHWYGAGADLIIRTTPAAQPYIIGGAAIGAGRGPKGGGEDPGIGAWAGVGYEIITFGPLGLQAEATYSWRSKTHLDGFVLGLKLGTRLARKNATDPLPPAQLPPSNPSDEETIRLATAAKKSGNAAAGEVVSTALGAMGAPYRWGGADSTGFDCSGLIRYAYGEHGIVLPRRSVDQARTGSEVGHTLKDLQPGDILTFSDAPGGSVSHVGLYIGEGKFIHSATGGVQVSTLSADDPIGRWWWSRWVGARRLL